MENPDHKCRRLPTAFTSQEMEDAEQVVSDRIGMRQGPTLAPSESYK